MNLWHASTELHTTAAVVAKSLALAAGLETGYALGLALDAAAHLNAEAGLNGTSDTSG